MTLVGAVAKPVYGAWRLARLDPEGLKYFDVTPAGFWFSFFAAVLSLPAYALIVVSTWMNAADDVPVLRIGVVELIAYVIAWTAYPVILPLVLRALNREQHYIRGVVAYNWAAVIQYLVYMPVILLSLMGISAGPLSLIVLFMVFFYSWYVAKTALDIHPFAAWGIVILDIIIGLVLGAWSENIIYG
jgi:hypothetical protein